MTPDLACPACGATYGARPDEPWRCTCGGPLEFAARPTIGGTPDPSALDRSRGLWAFADWIPVAERVTLGEGWTPLVDAPGWDAAFKLEYVFPTGSFKDRGATTTVSRALELGVERLVEDSSGNAGTALATYAARAGLDAEIYVPAGVKSGKLRAIERAGADVVRIEGDREAVTAACHDRVAAGGGWYASHAWHPAFLAGTATMAFEVCAQRGWTAPDAVVCPLGHGTLFLGAYRGFTRLHESGVIDRTPRLLGAQAAGYAPIAAARHGETDARNDRADGIRIREPARREEIHEAIETTDGDAVAIGADATDRALDRLHAAGFYTEPTCAVAPAALEVYRERGVLSGGEDVVVPLTGSGFKTENDQR